MRRPTRHDPARAWASYDGPWDRDRVAHLHRRAGFAAPLAILERDLKDGPVASVDRLLGGEPTGGQNLPADEFERWQDEMAVELGASGSLARAQGVWLHRMILTPHPLRERMTLFWHDHFATSNAKVNDLRLMVRQNMLLRKYAMGDFRALLAAIARDPAMLVWLDSATNRKAHPNENYAREVMELFALGRGHYTEKDVQEAARAFSGTFVQGGRFVEVASQHDDGDKAILGRTGRFRGDDVAAILLDQPACAEFLAGKLYRHFVDEVDEPSADLIAPLAECLRSAAYDIAAPIGLILRSNLFYSDSVRRRRVKSPVEFAVGTIRALEVVNPTVAAEPLAEAVARMGQSLYAPPSVAGWDGGAAWINTTTTLARTNFALELLADGKRFDAERLARSHGKEPGEFFVELLVQDAFDDGVRRKVKGSAKEVATLVLSSPEYQLA